MAADRRRRRAGAAVTAAAATTTATTALMVAALFVAGCTGSPLPPWAQQSDLTPVPSTGSPPVSSSVADAVRDWNADTACVERTIDFSDEAALKANFHFDWCGSQARSGALHMQLSKDCGSNIVYNYPLRAGRVEVEMAMAAGSGVVSSIVVIDPQSKDELDWEMVGKDVQAAQSMYYVSGQRVDMVAGFHGAKSGGSDLAQSVHTYGLDFTQNKVEWMIDGKSVRSLLDLGVRPFPKKFSQLRIGIWDGSNTNGWAGVVDWTRAPFTMLVKSVHIKPYC
ncbi:concanavalin A-like lectin/glucanase [Ramicandelaber brevisporus]|nr:concanavalin A-like lectin/glucanase [Ramicandelaber brevisporus]